MAVCVHGGHLRFQILSALVKSGSVMLLELLVTIIGREEEHAHEEAVQQALAAFAQRSVITH